MIIITKLSSNISLKLELVNEKHFLIMQEIFYKYPQENNNLEANVYN